MTEPQGHPEKSDVVLQGVRSVDGKSFVIDVHADTPLRAEKLEPPRRRRLFAGVALLTLAMTGGLVALLTPRAAPPETITSATPTARENLAALWEKIDRSDPVAVRKFMDSNGAGAAQARMVLATLDRAGWNVVEQQSAAEDILRALDAYDLNFPDGTMHDEARTLRASTQQVVFDIESELTQQGFKPGAVDGVSTSETVSAARAYQQAMGLPVSGTLNAALLGQLRATGFAPHPAAAAPSAADSKLQPTSTATPSKPFRDCYLCPEMVMIPPGSATIGDIAGDGDPDERPTHKVTIPAGLAVGRYEVTFEEWDACVADGGCATTPSDEGWGRGRRPVINVNLRDAKSYANWLSRKTGKYYRLLSEAEWEYAARAGAATRYAFGDDAAQLCAYGNHADNSTDYPWRNRGCSDGYAKQAAPAGAFKPNAFGLSDMQGNVWEWVEDCWHDDYVGAPTNGSAWTSSCNRAGGVLRGGAWSVKPGELRASYRYFFEDGGRTPFFGFRVAKQAR